LSKFWYCPKHDVIICAENEYVPRVPNHRFVMECKAILRLVEDVLIFKLPLEAPA